MLLYFGLFLAPALISVAPYRMDPFSRRIIYGLVALSLIFFIGFREHVGFDWNNYLRIFEKVSLMDLTSVLLSIEPGYSLVNWISSQFDWGIYGVNVICSIIFTIGLIAFALRQPSFWRTLALAMPVLIIGVGMSATRQAVAIGFLMLALNAFQDRRLFRFLFWVVLAVTFHRSSFIFILMAPLLSGRIRLWHLALAGIAFFLISIFLTGEATSYYTDSYVNTEITASGAIPRVGLNVLSAGLFFYFRKAWAERYNDTYLFSIGCGAMLLMVPGMFNAAAAVDRMEMYLLPIQCAVMARLPMFFRAGVIRTQVSLGIFALYGAVLAVWLNFSPFTSLAWIPYQNILFMLN
ncbi:MAG: EpsG family protein [Caulobacter sp.]|nr:EpsG family protein [Caulobacter sp.]